MRWQILILSMNTLAILSHFLKKAVRSTIYYLYNPYDKLPVASFPPNNLQWNETEGTENSKRGLEALHRFTPDW